MALVLRLLKNLIESPQNDGNKEKIVTALLDKVQRSWTEQEISSLYFLGIECLVEESRPEQHRKYGEMILRKISQTHPTWLTSLFQESASFLVFFQDKQGDSLALGFDTAFLVVTLLREISPSVSRTDVTALFSMVAGHLLEDENSRPTPALQESIANVLVKFGLSSLKDHLFCFEVVLSWLVNTSVSNPKYLFRWKIFSDLCVRILHAARLGSLSSFVTVLCFLISSTPSIECGPLVLLSQPQFYLPITKEHFSELIQEGGSSVSLDLIRTLSRFNSWPMTKGLASWYEAIVDALAIHDQHLLYRFLPEYLPLIASQMLIPEFRNHAFQLIHKILMSAQASPSLFLSLLNIQKTPILIKIFDEYIPYRDSFTKPKANSFANPVKVETVDITKELIETVEALQKKEDQALHVIRSANDNYNILNNFLQELAQLCFVQIHMHSGFPEHHIPLIKSIRGQWAPQSKSQMDEKIGFFEPWKSYSSTDALYQMEDHTTATTTTNNNHSSESSVSSLSTKTHSKSGIINVGNNCYMNRCISFLVIFLPFCIFFSLFLKIVS
eukprot:TRINITY_DN8088_c0_g1_i1.p1 TRINITY_DN8088_c0_g1~~TRINITY_DN8088_c0_g1_i1.p1  ORF type:complete len:556 (+),score=90.10 TRINITY_DN8088_c0_g1_i1:26-1693(+)